MMIQKVVAVVTETLRKEVIKMKTLKKIMAVTIIFMMAIGYSVTPAMAYVELKTPVSVTATGEIIGDTVAFDAQVVPQAGGSAQSEIDFSNPSGVANSGDALKIRGGTNVVGGRVIIYTDNASYFTSQDHDPRVKKVGLVYKPTGIDGAGLVGQTEKGYVAALIWGVSTTPNTPAAYTFDGDLNDKIGEVYIVDKGHTFSFVGIGTPTDTQALYRLDGTPVTNALLEGVDSDGNPVALYPQSFGTVGAGTDFDLYDKIASDTSRVVVSQQLTKNIATIAYNIGPGTGANTGFYVCQMPNLTTTDGADFVSAKLGKTDGTAGTEIYVNVGGVFSGLPAQVYETNKLYVAIVQD